MKTRIEGHTKTSITITTDEKQEVIECADCIVKLWLSSGTILGIKYCDNLLYHNIWKIRVLYGPVNAHYNYKQCFDNDGFDLSDNCCSDVFETEEEVVNIRIIHRSHYMGDDV